jgi:hypothetical protein
MAASRPRSEIVDVGQYIVSAFLPEAIVAARKR